MKYEFAPDIQKTAEEIIRFLFPYINPKRVKCYRSYGSSSKNTVARCHALGKLMQKALGEKAFYVLEFLSESFDRLNEDEKIKVVIHELMHIPKCFGGGFRYHDFVCERNVSKCFKIYKLKKSNNFKDSLSLRDFEKF